MAAKLRVAVVGTGFIGPVHVEALHRLGIEVAGLVGSDPARALPKAQALGVGRVYASFEEMLGDPTIQVVHITSPNHLHFLQVRAALAADKHVICEKPLAVNPEESSELLRMARARRRVHAVNFNIRFYPLVHEARARVAAGELGDLFIVHGSYLQDWLLYETDWNWRLQPEFSGPMRAVADIGSHWLDLITFVTGRTIESVFADFSTMHSQRFHPEGPIETFASHSTGRTVAENIGTEDYATVLLRFEGGMRGALTVSQVSAGRKNRLAFELDGAKSSLAWESERPNELWIGHRERANEVLIRDPSLLSPDARRIASYPGGHNEGFPDTFKQLYATIYPYIEAGDFDAKPDFPTFEDGHYELLLGEAIYRSAKAERWIQVGSAKGEAR